MAAIAEFVRPGWSQPAKLGQMAPEPKEKDARAAPERSLGPPTATGCGCSAPPPTAVAEGGMSAHAEATLVGVCADVTEARCVSPPPLQLTLVKEEGEPALDVR